MTQAVGGVPPQQRQRAAKIRHRFERPRQRLDVVAADHHAAERHELADRRPQLREIRAEQPAVERQRRQRPAGQCRAGAVRQIVGMLRVERELHLAVLREIVDQLGTGRQIRLAAVVRGRADDRIEIAPRVRNVVGKSGLARLFRPRHPDRAGGGRGGAADLRRLLAEQDVEPLQRADQRRGHAGGARAGDENVDLDVSAHSILMLASRTTFDHLSVSAFM